MRNRYGLLAIGLVAALLAVLAPSVGEARYKDCAVPPVVGSSVKPNLIFLLDYSGSMQAPAYNSAGWGGSYYSPSHIGKWNGSWEDMSYDPSITRYGIFESDKYYKYHPKEHYWFPILDFHQGETIGGTIGTAPPYYDLTEPSRQGTTDDRVCFTAETETGVAHDFEVGDLVSFDGLTSHQEANGNAFEVMSVSGKEFCVALTWNGVEDAALGKVRQRIIGNLADGLSGNVLNYMITTRADAAYKALIGGAQNCSDSTNPVDGDGNTECLVKSAGRRIGVRDLNSLGAYFYLSPTDWEAAFHKVHPDDPDSYSMSGSVNTAADCWKSGVEHDGDIVTGLIDDCRPDCYNVSGCDNYDKGTYTDKTRYVSIRSVPNVWKYSYVSTLSTSDPMQYSKYFEPYYFDVPATPSEWDDWVYTPQPTDPQVVRIWYEAEFLQGAPGVPDCNMYFTIYREDRGSSLPYFGPPCPNEGSGGASTSNNRRVGSWTENSYAFDESFDYCYEPNDNCRQGDGDVNSVANGKLILGERHWIRLGTGSSNCNPSGGSYRIQSNIPLYKWEYTADTMNDPAGIYGECDTYDSDLQANVYDPYNANHGYTEVDPLGLGPGKELGDLAWARVAVRHIEDDRQGVVQQNWANAHIAFLGFAGGSTSNTAGEILWGFADGTDTNGDGQIDDLERISQLLEAVEGEQYGSTPLGPGLRESRAYLKMDPDSSSNWRNKNDYIKTSYQATDKDPYYRDTGRVDSDGDPVYEPVWCRGGVVISISDGEWNQGTDPKVRAYELHMEDLRTGTVFPGDQRVNAYAIFAFNRDDDGENALKSTAAFGAFDNEMEGCPSDFPYTFSGTSGSSLNDTWPRANCPGDGTDALCCKQWDNDGDGVPDAYVLAEEGYKLEKALAEIIAGELQSQAAASAVATVSQQSRLGELVVRGAFDAADDARTGFFFWHGHLEAFWPHSDPAFGKAYGKYDFELVNPYDLSDPSLLECNEGRNLCLDMNTFSSGECPARNCWDAAYELSITANLDMDNCPSAFGGSDRMDANSAGQGRCIFTMIDDPGTPEFDPRERTFHKANVELTETLLGITIPDDDPSDSVAGRENVIDYIRGADIPEKNYRDRTSRTFLGPVGSKTYWRFADVVYSTPVVVGPPTLGAVSPLDDKIGEYYGFRNDNIHRMKMVYVGANDGMLHAFVLSKWKTDRWINQKGPDSDPDMDPEIGRELWAYIPSNLLNVVRELHVDKYGRGLIDGACPHLTTVDLAPRAFTVFIKSDFCPLDGAGNQPERCWRTVLLGGERGGGDMYFAIDVTDAREPHVLWEYSVLQNHIYVEDQIACLTSAEFANCVTTNCDTSDRWQQCASDFSGCVGTAQNERDECTSGAAPESCLSQKTACDDLCEDGRLYCRDHVHDGSCTKVYNDCRAPLWGIYTTCKNDCKSDFYNCAGDCPEARDACYNYGGWGYPGCKEEYNDCKDVCNNDYSACRAPCDSIYNTCKQPCDNNYGPPCQNDCNDDYDDCAQGCNNDYSTCEGLCAGNRTTCKDGCQTTKNGCYSTCGDTYNQCFVDAGGDPVLEYACQRDRDDCEGSCDGSYNTCNNGCNSTYNSCEDACDATRDSCVSALGCDTTKTACIDQCNSDWNSCMTTNDCQGQFDACWNDGRNCDGNKSTCLTNCSNDKSDCDSGCASDYNTCMTDGGYWPCQTTRDNCDNACLDQYNSDTMQCNNARDACRTDCDQAATTCGDACTADQNDCEDACNDDYQLAEAACNQTQDECARDWRDVCESECALSLCGGSQIFSAYQPFSEAGVYEEVKTLPLSWSKPYVGSISFPIAAGGRGQGVEFYVGSPDSNHLPTEKVVYGVDDDQNERGPGTTSARRAVAIMGGGVRVFNTDFLSEISIPAGEETAWENYAKSLFEPRMHMIDIETGKNLFKYVWPVMVRIAGTGSGQTFEVTDLNNVSGPSGQYSDHLIPFAMSDPVALDLWHDEMDQAASDGYLDHIFVGDLSGYYYTLEFNMDEYTRDSSDPGIEYPNSVFGMHLHVWPTKPIVTADVATNVFRGVRQPIASTVSSSLDPEGPAFRIIFGTGKFDNATLDLNDKTDSMRGALYNVKFPLDGPPQLDPGGTFDPASLTFEGTNPQAYEIFSSTNKTNFHVFVSRHCDGLTFKTRTDPAHGVHGCMWGTTVPVAGGGEKIVGDCCINGDDDCTGTICYDCIYDLTGKEELGEGEWGAAERFVNKPLIAGGLVFATSYEPRGGACSGGGWSRLYVFHYKCQELPADFDPFPNPDVFPPDEGPRALHSENNPNNGVSGYVAGLGHGMASNPVLDSAGQNVIIQMSNSNLLRIPVNLLQDRMDAKGARIR